MEYGPLIQIENLSIGYGDSILHKDLNLKVGPGEVICLTGPNGAGKSTLLRTLMGELPPLNGNIFIKGKKIEEFNPKELSRVVSIVLTQRPTIPDSTVKEVVALGRFPYTNIWGKLKEEDLIQVEETIQFLGIQDLQNKKFNHLSDGQKQKVLLARALAQNTPLLFLDEPTTFLDLSKKVELFQVLKKLTKEKGKSIIFSSHEWDFILRSDFTLWSMDLEGSFHHGQIEDLFLTGPLGRQFEMEGIFIDPSTGVLQEEEWDVDAQYVHIEWERKKLNFDETYFLWTVHSLKKIKFIPTKTTNPLIPHILITKNEKGICWNFTNRGEFSEHYSLKELGSKLKEIKN